jgi:hypothetical protein
MILVKVMKRKDAASVLVAIVIAMAVTQFLSIVTMQPAAKLAGLGQSGDGSFFSYPNGWRGNYLQPAVTLLVQLVAFEVLAWVFVLVHRLAVKLHNR